LSATRAEETDWLQIVRLYDVLERLPSPIVSLNRAVAIAMVDSPQAAIRLWINTELDGYHLFHAARADLLRSSSRPELQTSTGTGYDSERRFLERLREVQP